jgi:hypothetical protein
MFIMEKEAIKENSITILHQNDHIVEVINVMIQAHVALTVDLEREKDLIVMIGDQETTKMNINLNVKGMMNMIEEKNMIDTTITKTSIGSMKDITTITNN